MANKKKFYQSTTFWINLIIVIFFGLIGLQVPISSNLEITFLGLLNIGLRFLTKKAII